jgi:hypothetical protein
MANTFVILSAENIGNDVCQIVATVNGLGPVTITPWLSLINQQPNVLSVENLIAPMILKAAIAAGLIAPTPPVTVPSVTAAGTFSQ